MVGDVLFSLVSDEGDDVVVEGLAWLGYGSEKREERYLIPLHIP